MLLLVIRGGNIILPFDTANVMEAHSKVGVPPYGTVMAHRPQERLRSIARDDNDTLQHSPFFILFITYSSVIAEELLAVSVCISLLSPLL